MNVMNRNDLIEMYSIWVKPDFLSTEAIASTCADETIRFAKEYHKEQLILKQKNIKDLIIKTLKEYEFGVLDYKDDYILGVKSKDFSSIAEDIVINL